MEFYTNVQVAGDKILLRGYENGKPYQRRIDYMPTLFVNSKGKTKWQTLDGVFVDEVQPGTIRETREFLKRYEDVQGFSIFGQTNYGLQYLSDQYDYDINWDIEQIKIFTIDIETKTEEGFPNITTANEEVLLITVKDFSSKRIITFGVGAFVHNRDDVVYINCKDEQQLLKEFIIWWQQNYPDIITG